MKKNIIIKTPETFNCNNLFAVGKDNGKIPMRKLYSIYYRDGSNQSDDSNLRRIAIKTNTLLSMKNFLKIYSSKDNSDHVSEPSSIKFKIHLDQEVVTSVNLRKCLESIDNWATTESLRKNIDCIQHSYLPIVKYHKFEVKNFYYFQTKFRSISYGQKTTKIILPTIKINDREITIDTWKDLYKFIHYNTDMTITFVIPQLWIYNLEINTVYGITLHLLEINLIYKDNINLSIPTAYDLKSIKENYKEYMKKYNVLSDTSLKIEL